MKLVIVGGVAGGASTAARARRLDESLEIVMFDRGEYPSFANCGLAYYIGGEIQDRDDLLVSSVEELKDRFNIDVRMRSEVKRIDRDAKEVEVLNLETGETYRESYDKLVLAPGADPVKPPLPGIDLDGIFTLRTVPDADAIKDYIAQRSAMRAVVVGGGFIGLEMAEMLRRVGLKVTLVELLDQVMAPLDPEMASPLHQELRLNCVELKLGHGVQSFSKEGGLLKVHLDNEETIPCDLVVLCIGVKPCSELAADAGLDIGERKGIVVDEHMRTSDPDIYAVGDAVETEHFVTGERVIVPLGGPANRQGRIAADNICGRDSTYRKTLGTAIVRCFGIAAGGVGANEKTLKRLNIPYQKCYLHPNSHGSYYPGGQTMSIKLLFGPDDGRILGAQIVGGEGVDKRIDVIATAMRGGMTVFDLEHLELAYAPQYSSAKDPVNLAGFVAANILRGDVDAVQWDELEQARAQGAVVLDVRTAEEREAHHIEGDMHIPVNELRARAGEAPRDKPIVTYCAVGLRGYVAQRMLKQMGFDVKNLVGGWRTYYMATAAGDEEMEMSEPLSPSESDASQCDSEAPELKACVDARGLQCPGPIIRLSQQIEKLQPGDELEIVASDPGFAADLPAWCKRTGHEMLSLGRRDGDLVGRVRVGAKAQPAAQAAGPARTDKTLIVFSNDLDKVMASFIIANGAASMGRKVTMFFTFWGLNVLRKNPSPSVSKGFMDKMFGMMMPKGPTKLKLSKMHMAGMGTAMMKMVMRQKNAQSLPELIEMAKEQGVRLVACTMSMDVMGIKKEELIDGVEEGGVAAFLESAELSDMSLFI